MYITLSSVIMYIFLPKMPTKITQIKHITPDSMHVAD